eukprot:GILK01004848.1.p1 GENE.GILK01004848.1~~GILK01004848.1.p1  ORF type:complete len:617 (-),score=128.04 GILK01004848.1:158-1951(-)
MADEQAVLNLANTWLRLDKDPKTRKEIQDMLDGNKTAELRDRLCERVAFGTAGLRAAMGAGFSRLNNVTITQASQGLCAYLEETLGLSKLQSMGVVVGYDARHNSTTFAHLTAAVFVSKGVPVYLFNRIVSTPTVPFTVVHVGAAAGVMVTASHNPKQDNGYKVYWSTGCQIISPHDKGIANQIDLNQEMWPVDDVLDSQTLRIKPNDLIRDRTDEMIDTYFNELRNRYVRHRESNAESTVKFVYTAMHGVGYPFAVRAFEAFGLRPFIPVPEQIQPDPEFPTVTYPNPEEGRGALSLAIRTAEENGSTVILANDPDADRLAVAEKQSNGQWKIFTGNEIASLLGWWMFECYKQNFPQSDNSKLAIVASTVSSKFLKALAEKEGMRFDETLTGFKWMSNKTIELESEGYTVLFSFEEAIGFCIGNLVRDKDGVSAAGAFAEMTVQLARQQITLSGKLEQLYQRYGYFVTQNRYFLCYSQPTIKKMFDNIRSNGQYLQTVGRFPIRFIRDLTTGFDNEQPNNTAILPTSSSSQMITFTFENGGVITLRTSGTEPKIKYYSELKGSDEHQTKEELAAMVDAVIQELFRPEEYGLIPPSD